MRKLNNKAFSLVELIVTFAYVMVLVVALFGTINEYKDKVNQRLIDKEMNAYKNEIIKTVYDDINLFGIDKVEILKSNTDLEGYEKGIEITYFNYTNDSSINHSKKLLVKQEEIKYGKVIFKRPSSFVSFPSDFIFFESSNSFDYKFSDGSTEYTLKKTLVNINIPMENKENNKRYDINIISYINGEMSSTSKFSYNEETGVLTYTGDSNKITIPKEIDGKAVKKFSGITDENDGSVQFEEIDFSNATEITEITGTFKGKKIYGLDKLTKLEEISQEAFEGSKIDLEENKLYFNYIKDFAFRSVEFTNSKELAINVNNFDTNEISIYAFYFSNLNTINLTYESTSNDKTTLKYFHFYGYSCSHSDSDHKLTCTKS